MPTIHQSKLISHHLSAEAVELCVQKIAERLTEQGDKPYTTVKYQLDLLHQLSQFNFGRFLLRHQGINGYWTHYMLMHPWNGRKTGRDEKGNALSSLERFLLDSAPLMLATQQRFEIFINQNQQKVQNDAVLACIPCGMMGELLYLNYDQIDHIKLSN